MAYSVMNDLIRGNDYFLYLVDLNGSGMTSGKVASAKVIAYATSCSLEINADVLSVSTKQSCRWNQGLPGVGSYSVNADALYCKASSASDNGATTIDDLYQDMIDGTNVGWVMALDQSSTGTTCTDPVGPYTGATYYYGEASIASLSINAGNNEIVSSSISLTGSGAPLKGGPTS